MSQQFGIARYVFNWALEQKKKEYEVYKNWKLNPVGQQPKSLSAFDYQKILTKLKSEIQWIGNAHSQVLQQEINHLFSAYKRFCQKIKERKVKKQKYTNSKGRLLDFPRFKSKRDHQSLSLPQSVKVDFDKQLIQIPKVGKVCFICSRRFVGAVKTTTISKTTTGKYYASILVDDGLELPELANLDQANSIGIDVGLTHFATLSTGEKIANPKFLKTSLPKLKRLQRSMARKTERSSKNYGKAKLRRALLEEKIANKRSDFLHKATHRLVCKNQATSLCVEDLCVRNMMQNHHLARSIADVGWGEFFRQLKYKTLWHGKRLLEIGRFEPSSKTCSDCGYQVESMSLSVRHWQCPGCGVKQDRDINAAKNMVSFAFRKIPVGQPGVVKVSLFTKACGQDATASPLTRLGKSSGRSRKTYA